MQLLLDTHVLLWWMGAPESLSTRSRSAISDPTNIVWLSSATVWEVRILAGIGKLDLPPKFDERLSKLDFRELPIRHIHVERVGRLPDLHKDPFDRILVAQAIEERLTIVTRDPQIRRYTDMVLPA